MPYILSSSGPIATTGVLYSANVAQERTVTLIVDDNGGGSTITAESSTDNSTWTSLTTGLDLTSGYPIPLLAATITAKGRYLFQVDSIPYIRFRVSTYVSGYVSVRVEESVFSNRMAATPSNAGINAGLVNFDPSNMSKWRAALSKVRGGVSNAAIACVGDSTMRGQGAGSGTAAFPNAWPVKMGVQLAANAGVAVSAQNFFGTGNSTITNNDSRVALTGTFTTSVVSVGGNLFKPTAAATLAFTPVGNADTFDVYSVNNGTGSFTINLDGGATLATVNTTSTGTIVKTTVTGTLAGHTLNCVWVSGAPYILGVDAYDGTSKKVRVWNWGALSYTTNNWTAATTVFDPLNVLSSTGTVGTALVADLYIIDLGINEWSIGVSPGTYRTNLRAMITACRNNGDVILKTPVPTQETVVSRAVQKQYVDIMYELAYQNNIPLIDTWGRFEGWTKANGLGMFTDNKHPNATGYSDVALVVAKALAFD